MRPRGVGPYATRILPAGRDYAKLKGMEQGKGLPEVKGVEVEVRTVP